MPTVTMRRCSAATATTRTPRFTDAADLPYDGVDTDCDGAPSTTSMATDTWLLRPGKDCDDTDPSLSGSPGHLVRWGLGL